MGMSFPRKRESTTRIFGSPIKAFGDDKIVSSRNISFDPASRRRELKGEPILNSSPLVGVNLKGVLH
jgi:hypothetical protein